MGGYGENSVDVKFPWNDCDKGEDCLAHECVSRCC